jgi:hypothetical protein
MRKRGGQISEPLKPAGATSPRAEQRKRRIRIFLDGYTVPSKIPTPFPSTKSQKLMATLFTVFRPEKLLVNGAMEEGGDLPRFDDQLRKLFGQDGLHAVRKSAVGVVVDFDEQAVGAHRDRGAR